eukprot:7272787-Prymnesium_polylepis.1
MATRGPAGYWYCGTKISVGIETPSAWRKLKVNVRRASLALKDISSGVPLTLRAYGRTRAGSARPPECRSAGDVRMYGEKTDRSSPFQWSPSSAVFSGV